VYILAVNISHHCSICLLKDGDIVFFQEEDRFSRNKHHYTHCILESLWSKDPGFNTIKNDIELKTIQSLPKELKKIDHIIFCTTGLSSDSYVMNIILDQIRSTIEIENIHHYPEHHLYHACSAFYNSGFDTALSLVLDGGGFNNHHEETQNLCDMKFHEQETVFVLDYNNIRSLLRHYSLSDFKFYKYNNFKNTRSYHERNKMFSASWGCGGIFNLISLILGFGNEAGKTMGLAAYGNADNVKENWFVLDEKNDLWITDNNAILKSFASRFDLPENLNYLHQVTYIAKVDEKIGADLAKKAQQETLNRTIKLIEKYSQESGEKNVVLSGGYFLNCSNNYEYLKRFPNLNFFIDPIAHDGGTALGAAKYLWHKLTGDTTKRRLETLYLGLQND